MSKSESLIILGDLALQSLERDGLITYRFPPTKIGKTRLAKSMSDVGLFLETLLEETFVDEVYATDQQIEDCLIGVEAQAIHAVESENSESGKRWAALGNNFWLHVAYAVEFDEYDDDSYDESYVEQDIDDTPPVVAYSND